MRIHTDYIEPNTLTGYVRASLRNQPQNRFRLAAWLPNRDVDDLQYRFNRGGDGLAEAATYRAYDAESAIGTRPGLTRVTGELPPVSRKVRLGEYDRLRQRQANDSIVSELMNDAERMASNVSARVELARGDALVNGSVTIDEGGLHAEVDFGRAMTHTTTASTGWNAGGTALTDLIAWHDVYVATNGESPGALVTSTTVARLMQRNAEVINAVTGAAAGRTRVTSEELNALLGSEGLPPVTIYDARVRVNGSGQRVIPEDVVLLLPAPTDPFDDLGTDLGGTLWGTTAEALDPAYGVEGDEPGIVAGVYSTEDPIALWTKASAIALPVLANPDLSFAATVIDPGS